MSISPSTSNVEIEEAFVAKILVLKDNVTPILYLQ